MEIYFREKEGVDWIRLSFSISVMTFYIFMT